MRKSLAFFRLPIRPERVDIGMDNSIQDAYLNERKQLTAKNLRRFLTRWKAIWELPRKRRLSKEERILLVGRYSSKKLYEALRVVLNPDAIGPKTRYERLAIHIAIPIPLMESFGLAKHYGVSTDLAMVRMFVHTQPGYEGWGF